MINDTLHILQLEDSALDAELTTALLQDGGMAIAATRVDTREGFEAALQEAELDLILADYALPSFDGVSALEIARRRRPEVPFIFLSGTLGEEVAADAMKHGATDYVLKQRMGRLIPSIRRALREQRERIERRQIESKLRESENRFRLLVESLRDYAVFTLDPAGLITSWNEGAAQVLGYSEAQALGRPSAVLFTPEDRLAGIPAAEMTTAAVSGRALDERWHLRQDGTRFFASGILTAMRDDRGELVGYAKVMRDVTDRKRIEEERSRLLESEQAARHAAEEANRAKDDFLATVSHELRTPLTAILGWARMLRADGRDPATLEEGLETIERNAVSQAHIVDDILDISRIISGKMRLNAQLIDLSAVVTEALDSVRPAADAKGIALTFNVEGEPRVLGDAARLQQVAWNLLTNAIKFTPRGGNVAVRVGVESGWTRLVVADSGAGIEAEFLPHVFDRFRQADASSTRRHGGLGLGLSICRHLVELHGGTITADSEGPGRGATFTVILPLGQHTRSASTAMTAAEHRRTLDCPDALQGLRVVVVDDEPDALRLMANVLTRCGAVVMTAANVAEALRLLQTHEPDVLLSDIAMPDQDGYHLIRELRATQGDLARIPAAALTAYTRPEDRHRALAAGFHAHLGKPIEPGELIRAVADLAGRAND